MIELCEILSTTHLLFWQEIYIEWEMINVRLDTISFENFKSTVCNIDFLNSELMREI